MISNLEKPNIEWNFNKRIFRKNDVLSHKLCDDIISEGAPRVKIGVNKYPGAFDISFHSCLLPLNSEVHSYLQDVWKEAIDFFGFDVNFIEPYELKNYVDGDFFGSHVDNYYSINENLDRKLTMVVQLSDELSYSGGYLRILNTMAPKTKGSVVVFPSFFPHEVLKTNGSRWSLIGWAWGPYWK